jgi:uncharacterized protein YdcH (DUF465 family)
MEAPDLAVLQREHRELDRKIDKANRNPFSARDPELQRLKRERLRKRDQLASLGLDAGPVLV